MDKSSIPTLSFSSFDSNRIESAKKSASSAFSSAFNTVVTQPVNTIKNNITSSSNSTNETADSQSEDASFEEQNSSAKQNTSTKFLQVFTLSKAVNIISSLPTGATSKKLQKNSNTSSFENSSAFFTQTASSVSQTASSVLNKINPFEQSLENSPSSASDSGIKKFFFSAAASFSIDKPDRVIPGAIQEDAPFEENILDYNEQYLSDEELEMLEQNNKDIEDESGTPKNRSSLKRKTKPPVGSIEYEVVEKDTIEKIALKWNTIPSEILHMNRLVTRTIFPGQKIYVPDPNYVPPPHTEEPKSPLSTLKKQLSLSETTPKTDQQTPPQTTNSGGFSFLRWKTNSKPGHVEAQKSVEHKDETRRGSVNRHVLSEEEAKKLDEECMQRFLKINCKIVTRTKGCYEGVLIVTPSALMFDPFDSNAVNATLLHNESEETGLNETSAKHRTASTSSTNSIYDEASAIIPIEIISNIIMYEDLSLRDVQEYFDFQETKELAKKAAEKKLSTILDIDESKEAKRKTSSSSSSSNHVTFDLGNEHETKESTETNIETAAKSETTNENIEQVNEVKSEEVKTDSTINTNSDLISCYLCVKVNNNKDFLMCPLNRKMKNKLRSEFWFQINDNSYLINDKIFAFFLEWKSDPTFSIASQSDESHGPNTTTRRFQVIKPHETVTDLLDESLKGTLNKGFSSTNRLLNRYDTFTKDWEMVNLQELELKLKTEKDIENEYKTLPTLMNESLILKEDHLRKLNVNLIARAVGYNWVLSFSTEEHGFSLNTLYRKLADVEGPCLIVVKDTFNNIFGAMSSTKLYQSEHFYGTGESFLFTFWPSFKVYKWTGENNFFTRGTNESISFGCGDAYHGLWFDGDLLNGHTQRSKTYDNDMLTSSENFTIASLEVWTFND